VPNLQIHGHPASDYWWHNKDDFNDDGDRDYKVVHATAYGIDIKWYTN
jgi:hypothetical protein